jgi:hypothetical protein
VVIMSAERAAQRSVMTSRRRQESECILGEGNVATRIVDDGR